MNNLRHFHRHAGFIKSQVETARVVAQRLLDSNFGYTAARTPEGHMLRNSLDRFTLYLRGLGVVPGRQLGLCELDLLRR
jgi:hypothetical protein